MLSQHGSIMGRSISIVLEDGQEFKSAQDFCMHLGVKPPALSKALARGSTYQEYHDKILSKRFRKEEERRAAHQRDNFLKELLAAGAKPVPNYTGIYATLDGKIYSGRMHKYLSQSLCGQGYYMRVGVVSDSGRHVEYTHRLVCSAFHGPQPEGLRMTVDHIDRDKLNNHAGNLRWCEQSENNRNRGNHIYHDWKGERLILSEIAEQEVWDKETLHYVGVRISLKGDSIEKALAHRTIHISHGKQNKGSSLWIEIPALQVTGLMFPSVKQAEIDLKTCGKQLRKWVASGFLYEEIRTRNKRPKKFDSRHLNC